MVHDGEGAVLTIRELIESGDKEAALRWCDQAWERDPDSDEAAFYFANLMAASDHPGAAKFILEALIQKYPNKWQGHQNLGYCFNEMGLYDRALKALRKAAKIKPGEQSIEVGLSSCYANTHEWDKAFKHCDRALELGPSLQAEINKAFALLCTGRYGEGWDLYSNGMGRMPWRDKHEYGLKEGIGPRTLIYAEQGIGDQIAFCSALPDAIADGRVVAVNCHPKLETLFRDSFPEIKVFGDQFAQETHWIKGLGATHQAPMSALMGAYRRSGEDFPGRPFLKANPDKREQWRCLLDKHEGPHIGIAWTGGTKGSHGWRRKWLSDELLSQVMGLPGSLVCLEYNDLAKRPANLLEWKWATQTQDYSDTAALVAELDAVVGVQTSVQHLAGGLGIPAHVLCSELPHFHYAAGMPYYGSVRVYPRESALEVIGEIASHYPGRTGARDVSQPSDGERQDGDGVLAGAVLGGSLPSGVGHGRGNGAICNP